MGGMYVHHTVHVLWGRDIEQHSTHSSTIQSIAVSHSTLYRELGVGLGCSQGGWGMMYGLGVKMLDAGCLVLA